MDFEKILDTYYKKTLLRINSSLPRSKIRLINLLEAEEPSFETLDGKRSPFSKEELKDLFQNLPNAISVELRLPFVFLRNQGLGDGVYSIDGGKTEADAFTRLMGLGYDLPKASDGRYYTYKPLVFEFLKRYKTLGVVGFL